MKKSTAAPKVFFNASVVLAGLRNPSGGSGKLLKWVRRKIVSGIITEVVLDEVLRHCPKIGLTKKATQTYIRDTFITILPAPEEKDVVMYFTKVIDHGDAHIFASSFQARARYLVSLDKKHILVLARRMKGLTIVTPGEFIDLFEYDKTIRLPRVRLEENRKRSKI